MSENVGRRGIMVVVMGMMVHIGGGRLAYAQPALVVNDSGGSVSLSLGAGEAFHTTDRSVQDARVVTVPDSSVTAIVWKELAVGEADRDFYALSADGVEITRVR